MVQFLVLELLPARLVRWRCISSHPANVPASDWTGTQIKFRIGDWNSSQVASQNRAAWIPVQTVVQFEHSDWPEDSRYFAFRSYAWADVPGRLARQAAEGCG